MAVFEIFYDSALVHLKTRAHARSLHYVCPYPLCTSINNFALHMFTNGNKLFQYNIVSPISSVSTETYFPYHVQTDDLEFANTADDSYLLIVSCYCNMI